MIGEHSLGRILKLLAEAVDGVDQKQIAHVYELLKKFQQATNLALQGSVAVQQYNADLLKASKIADPLSQTNRLSCRVLSLDHLVHLGRDQGRNVRGGNSTMAGGHIVDAAAG